MHFFSNIPNNLDGNIMMNNSISNPMDGMMVNNDLFYKLNEIENRIKKLEQRIIRLESDNGNNVSYSEPDNSLYMI